MKRLFTFETKLSESQNEAGLEKPPIARITEKEWAF